MLRLTEKGVDLDVTATDAKEAIRLAGRGLEREGKVTGAYVDRMVEAYESVGAYIVVAPGIAFPHARPGEDVLGAGVSFIRLQEPVRFGHDLHDPVTFVCGLCGVDKMGHINMLQQLSRALGNDDTLAMLKQAKTKQQIINLLQKEEK
ncbi:PTS sugar transporter subunit IIA [Anaerobacillus sp. 1_MG-2023]|uniref:PTS sugar transporter subunit IIA n=1 Tax=Anaerobacillus sp. 1_MG-2023 TaxID=3062655 RepID=UPI0026E1DE12|nr:PTS sugar transporter subunit IIA [Anaerobacillus sp. 1_MG-2023]MDO6657412.1 PTS sugar transporter subunit IIA [Anaerobacillus sp. 1_MG-2023]